jgi:hypothetical protein
MEADGFVLDSIATVVDCVNFTGYEDTSYTAKMQAQYTDVILLNKHELVSSFSTPMRIPRFPHSPILGSRRFLSNIWIPSLTTSMN